MTTDTAASPLLASFRDCYRDLLRYLSLRTGNADEARDLVHDTWLRAADLASQGREPDLQRQGDARAYLFTMARNLAIDQRRRDGVALRHAGQQGPGEAGVPDAAEAAMYGQAITAVDAALAGLPERARQIFLRHRVNGEDQGALAVDYGISRNMVERDMMLAMDRVGAAMQTWHGGSVDIAVRTGRRRSLAALLGVTGIAVGAGGGWRWWRMVMPQWEQVAATGHGQSLQRPLPDGSALTLDAQTRVQMAYFAARRSVRLMAGAVFCDVVADATRPFVVDVPADAGGTQRGVRITVLGTRFGVERLPGGAVDVQVESGRVRVEAVGDDGQLQGVWELGAEESARVAADGRMASRRLGALQAAGWRHGVLSFDDASLGETVERLRRYLPRPVAVAPDAAALRVSGQVRIAQAEDFVRALPAIVPVRSQLAQGRWQIEVR